jgi:hypothetical protein
MGRFWKTLTSLYRRWRYVEEAPAGGTSGAPEGDEARRLRRAIERDERLVADYRRNGCPGLAKDREASLRALRGRLALLES